MIARLILVIWLALGVTRLSAAQVIERELHLPILHLPQLIGLALGIDAKELRVDRHVISTRKVLSRL